MRFDTLAQWLSWQETLNPAQIELGLERVNRVRVNAGLDEHFACPTIMVGGTNGKGSVMAMLESVARSAGYSVCSYTSPHLQRYNERIRINGNDVEDAALCAAFERIDQARGDERLTYFEFGTLAAIDLFMRAEPELVLLEVGLGGRLDAVNIMQPDVAIISSIGIDHTDWLGATRESIAREKAGIMRFGKICVCGDRDPPQSLLAHAAAVGAQLLQIGIDFENNAVPEPALQGAFQHDNAAIAVRALTALTTRLPISQQHIVQGLASVRLAGRYEQLGQSPEVICDVAHNEQAVASLLAQLQASPVTGHTHFVLAMLADKPVAAITRMILPRAQRCFYAGLNVARGMSGDAMAQHLSSAVAELALNVKLHAAESVEAACAAAMARARRQDRIVIFGSFYTVAAAQRFFHNSRERTRAKAKTQAITLDG